MSLILFILISKSGPKSTIYEIGLFSGLNSELILLTKVGLILITKWA